MTSFKSSKQLSDLSGSIKSYHLEEARKKYTDFDKKYINFCIHEGSQRLNNLEKEGVNSEHIPFGSLKKYCICTLDKIGKKNIDYIASNDIFKDIRECIVDVHSTQKSLLQSGLNTALKNKNKDSTIISKKTKKSKSSRAISKNKSTIEKTKKTKKTKKDRIAKTKKTNKKQKKIELK